MPIEPTRTRRDLFAISADGAAFCVMVGAAQLYVPAFVLALGHGEVAAGLVATLPPVAGALLQLAAPPWIARVGSLKRWVILLSTLQAASLVPLAWGAWQGQMPLAAVFALVTLYWAGGIGASPAWTSWVETLVPPRVRSRFFGVRQAVCQAGLFLGLVGGGAWLFATRGIAPGPLPFLLLFGAGAAARLVSVAFLTTQSERVPIPSGMALVPMRAILERLREPGPVRALFCFVPAMAAIQVAHPFFTSFALEQLRVGYDGYLWLVAAEYLGRIAALPAMGVLCRRFGARRVLLWGAVALSPVAALWAASDSMVWLVGVQVAAGVAWSAFELGGFLIFFEGIGARERTGVLTVHFFVASVAVAAGSLLGGAVLGGVGRTPAGYAVLFAVSTLARFAALRLLGPLRERVSRSGP